MNTEAEKERFKKICSDAENLFGTVKVLKISGRVIQSYYHFKMGQDRIDLTPECALTYQETEWMSDGFNFIWMMLESDFSPPTNYHFVNSTVEFYIKHWLSIPPQHRAIGLIQDLL